MTNKPRQTPQEAAIAALPPAGVSAPYEGALFRASSNVPVGVAAPALIVLCCEGVASASNGRITRGTSTPKRPA